MLHRLAAAFAVALALSSPALADTLVVTAARMVDVERGRYVDNPVVVVTDGRIISVGTSVPADLPADGRRLDLPVVNLGFSGNGKAEPEVARLLADLDPAIYVLDPLPNLTPAFLANAWWYTLGDSDLA